MRKGVYIILIVFLLMLVFVYFFIPHSISIKKNVLIGASQKGLYRTLGNESGWAKWWPGKMISESNGGSQTFIYDGVSYSISNRLLSSILISVKDNGFETKTAWNILPVNKDTVLVEWLVDMPAASNLIERVRYYFKSRMLGNSMGDILEKMQLYFSNPENIYGINIKEKSVVDSTLIYTYDTAAGYPSTSFIYELVDRLKNYIVLQSAVESGFPMLNITTTDSINYLVRVAIPVNRKLNDKGKISYKWMLGGGNILIAEVKGGPASIKNVFEQMHHYVEDNNRTSPAIPFQSLVTNRMQQPDSTKWITLIYYPVI